MLFRLLPCFSGTRYLKPETQVQIITDISTPVSLPHPVVTIGTFDGVHLGHKAILSEVTSHARENRGNSVVITFHPHPRIALGQQVYLLSTRAEKRAIFKQAGIDCLVEIPFSPEFARLDPEKFIELIHNLIKPRMIIIGYDHGFGHNRKGTIEQLFRIGEPLGIRISIIDEMTSGNSKISSTVIRWLLQEGDVEKAAELLGYPYRISGQVVRGNQIGKLIGFPTANLHLDDPNKLIPSMGVYVSCVTVRGKEYSGMTNIGMRPTIDAHKLTIETNIFDFDDEIYYESTTICLLKRIRNEKKFATLDLLQKQLADDKARILEILDNRL